jgi:pectate lyase
MCRKTRVPGLVAVAICAAACATHAGTGEASGDAGALAFPGAEGFGRFAVGGRGGRVIKVTNLDDKGPGSLRQAVIGRGPRTVVFEVSGIIDLERDLDIHRGNITIAGQTAPGDGITLRGHGLNVFADDVIIRFLRVRPGDEAGVETDAISVKSGNNVIIDHCSTSWATDETLSIAPSRTAAKRPIDNVTVQWSIISESLNKSVHSKGEHGFGSLLRGSDGARYSMHHNLWAHHRARMPRPGNYLDREIDPVGPVIDIRNNVFYNWGGSYSGYNADTESISSYNFVDNYYVTGPNSTKAIAFSESSSYASLYFAGNWMNGKRIDDPSSILTMPKGHMLAEEPHPYHAATSKDAESSYSAVLAAAGASLVRDSVDARIVADVQAGTGRIIDDVSEVGGWPVHRSGKAPVDSDGDGMPDDWEARLGLDPGDKSDGSSDPDGDGYTNLEDYLNSLVP